MKIRNIIAAAVVLLSLLLAIPGAAWADVAATGDYNWQTANYYVTADASEGELQLYYGPGMEYGVYGTVPNGTELHILSTADNYFDCHHWGMVIYDDGQFWIPLDETRWLSGDSTALVMDVYRYAKVDEYERYNFVVPAVNLESEEIQDFNRQIQDMLMADIQPVEDAFAAGTEPAEDALNEIIYEFCVNEDLLGLAIARHWKNGRSDILGYTISITQQRLLTREEVLQISGYDEESYREAASAILEDQCRYENDYAEEQYPEAFQTALEETLASSNLDDTIPVIAGEGELCFIGKVYLVDELFPYTWDIFYVEDY